MSLIKRVLLRLRRRQKPEVVVRKNDADVSNGFGAKRLLRSTRSQGCADAQLLEGVQLLTRYCAIERPYWISFVSHYHGLGVRRIQACVQSDREAAELGALPVPAGMEVCIHCLPSDCDPSAALHSLPFPQIAEQAPFTLMVDCDEYLVAFRRDLSLNQLVEVFPGIKQWFLPWLIRPLIDDGDLAEGGFWGHVGKPLIHSADLEGVAHDHGFRLRQEPQEAGQDSAPAGQFGLALVHFWSRSFRDCLLKTFNNRFRDAKSADLSDALALIRAHDLPVRLKLLAFLKVQSGYLALPASSRPCVDEREEARLLRACLSEDDEVLCRSTFDRYCEQLRQSRPTLPLYPAVPFFRLAELLPAVQSQSATIE